jgi:hypothetical protein
MSWPRVWPHARQKRRGNIKGILGPCSPWLLGQPLLAHHSTALRPEKEVPECFLRTLSTPRTANS